MPYNFSTLATSTTLANSAFTPAYTFMLVEDMDKSGFQNLGAADNHFEYKYFIAQSVNAGAGNDYVSGGSGWDKIYGDSGDDVLLGNAGSDQLYGGSGQDRLFGGNDGDTLDGGTGSDFLYGGLGNDIVLGGTGDDQLHGDNFLSYEKAGAGVDSLSGGAGNDVLYGDARGDFLLGGTGADRFVYTNVADSTLADHDQIRDFSHAEGDRIDLSSLAISDGRDHFSFANSSQPGSVWVGPVDHQASGNTIQSVYINVDGYIADMQIDVFLAPGAAPLNAGDFIF